MLKILLVAILMFSVSTPAAVVIEDGKTKIKKGKILPKTATDAIGLRAIRRRGFGVSAQGALGTAGVNMEVNFSPTWSGITGFGGGAGYQAFTIQAKRALYGEFMMPYVAMGYSRWYSIREGAVNKTNPTFLSEKFITPEQKANGDFDEHLFFPAFGLQYVQLNGDWAGFSMYVEVMMLVDVQDFLTAPTGTIGTTYYF